MKSRALKERYMNKGSIVTDLNPGPFSPACHSENRLSVGGHFMTFFVVRNNYYFSVIFILNKTLFGVTNK